MPEKDEYKETVRSRMEDIRKDGPNLGPCILENIENSFEWGDSTEVTIKSRESELSIYDNGPNGFGSIDSMNRFFCLGSQNENRKESTIGKYGKGGYKSPISLSTNLRIVSTIPDKNNEGGMITFEMGTNFNDMIEKDTMEPTNPLKMLSHEDIKASKHICYYKQMGSSIHMNLRPIYSNSLNMKGLSREIQRAYHMVYPGRKVIIISNSKKETIIIGENKPCDKYVYMKKDKLIKNLESNKYSLKTENYMVGDNEVYIGDVTEYVLKTIITKNDLLGDDPGIDFYRNGRLCNVANPVRTIGKIGENLAKGQMRGKKCHLECVFTDKTLNDGKTVDDDFAITTMKDVPKTSDKMDVTLIECLEKKAKDCNKAYENIIKQDGNNLKKYLIEIEINIHNVSYNELLEIKDSLIDFKEHQAYYKEDGKYVFCNSKDINLHEKKLRKNSPLLTKAQKILKIITEHYCIQRKYKDMNIEDKIIKIQCKVRMKVAKTKLQKLKDVKKIIISQVETDGNATSPTYSRTYSPVPVEPTPTPPATSAAASPTDGFAVINNLLKSPVQDDPNIVTPEPVRNTSIRAFSGSRVEYIQWLKEQVQKLTLEEKRRVFKR